MSDNNQLYLVKSYNFDPFIPMVAGLLAGLYIGKFGSKPNKFSSLESKL